MAGFVFIPTGKPVNDSFGVPLMRKSNPLMSNNVVKPKSNASAVVNTAITAKPSLVHVGGSNSSSSSLLPSNREKITFDFKLANCHHAQSSTSKMNLSPGNTSGNSGRSCSSVVDTSQQPKHPRIVMQIKNGKVYNYPQQTSTSGVKSVSCVNTPPVIPSVSCGAPGVGSTVSCLVPYAPDSSEDSDQDSGRTGNHVRSPGRPSNKVSSKCLLELREWSNTKVKLDPQLNATTQLPGLPKSKLVDDKEGDSKDCNGSQSSSSLSTCGNFVKKQSLTSDGQLMVLTNCGTAGGKINATSPWVVLDSNQQSPSVASEGSNTSVNSTSEWTVHDDKDATASKVERQYPKWTVTSSDSGVTSGSSGLSSPNGVKKTGISKCERTRESENVNHNSPKKAGNSKELKLVIVSSASRGCEMPTSRQPNPSSPSSPLPVTNSTNSSSEYKWTNGATEDDECSDRDLQKRLGQRNSPEIRSPVQDRASDREEEEESRKVDRREDANTSVRESANRRQSPMVNGTDGGVSESTQDDQNTKHRKKKRKHKKDRDSASTDDSQKWRNRVGQ